MFASAALSACLSPATYDDGSGDGRKGIGIGSLGSTCDHTSNCQDSFVCAFGFCREDCSESLECAASDQCVLVMGSEHACVPSEEQLGMDAAAGDGGDAGSDAGDGGKVVPPGSVANGAACGESVECESGYCVDGVCCDIACEGTCRACSSAKTGYPDGICASVEKGTDPDSECADPSAVSCAATAGCNGSAMTPACIVRTSDTTCSTASIAWAKTWAGKDDLFGTVGPVAVDDASGRVVFGTACQDEADLACDANASQGINVVDANGEPQWKAILAPRALFTQAKPLAFSSGGTLTVGFDTDGPGGRVAHLATFNDKGASRWALAFQQAGQTPSTSLHWSTVDGSGAVIAHFNSANGTDFGGGVATEQSLLVRYNVAGQYVSARAWTGNDALQSDSLGNLVVVSTPAAAPAYGCDVASGDGLWLAQVKTNVTCNWSVNAGGTVYSHAYDVDSSNNVIVAAVVAGSVNFGGGEVVEISGRDLVLAKLDAQGKQVWVKRMAAADFQGTLSLSAAANGDFVLGGTLVGKVDLGGGELSANAGAAYLAKFSGANGDLLGLHQFTASSFHFAADQSGNAVVVTTGKNVNLGGDALFTDFAGVALSKISWP